MWITKCQLKSVAFNQAVELNPTSLILLYSHIGSESNIYYARQRDRHDISRKGTDYTSLAIIVCSPASSSRVPE